MRNIILSSITAVCFVSCMCTNEIPRSQGSEAMDKALKSYIEEANDRCMDIHSIMIIRHGKVIEEAYLNGYNPQRIHEMWSCTKTFTAMAVGFAVQEGYLTLDTKFTDLFPEETAAVLDTISDSVQASRIKAATIGNYLPMSAGHSSDVLKGVCEKYGISPEVDGHGAMIDLAFGKRGIDIIKEFFAQSFTDNPGTAFFYDNECSHMLSCAVQKATGQKVRDYLEPRLFRPLGIEIEFWDEIQGYTSGGWGLSLKPEDMAKFGLCMLNGGKYKGKQVLPADFLKDASTRHFTWPRYPWIGEDEDRSINKGYGYQMWMNQDAFLCAGYMGQYILVLPEYDAVIVGTANLKDDHVETFMMWKHFIPVFEAEP